MDRLRELKDQADISTVALARKTAYSRSSWARCLNGQVVPPGSVIARFGEVAGLSGDDLARLLALWELAEHAEAEPLPPQELEPATVVLPRRLTGVWRQHRWARIVAVAGTAAATAAVVGVVVWQTTGSPPSPPAARVAVAPAGYSCDYTSRDSMWYAGHSTTSTHLVVLNSGGQDVVEVQCLLKHHGMDPGRIDGLFGEHTEQAVKHLQSAANAAADGKVGPQTWALLRT
ncbi:Putative peptidoglycan binding domain protein [Kutzneria sp. CA-103260]|nr:Putative peptidoglycan binding domain protein [Kutzneria sp. CA-103260]